MNNRAFVSMFIDRKASKFRERLAVPDWARAASYTAHGVVFPDAEYVRERDVPPVFDSLNLLPCPESGASREEQVAWRLETAGAEHIHVLKMASHGRNELHMLCIWDGVKEDSLSSKLESFFGTLADDLGVPFRVLYFMHGGESISGRIETDDGVYINYEVGTVESEDVIETVDRRLLEYRVRADSVPPEWELLQRASATGDAADAESESDEEGFDEEEEGEDEENDLEEEAEREYCDPADDFETFEGYETGTPSMRHRVLHRSDADALPPLDSNETVCIDPRELLRMLGQTAYTIGGTWPRGDLGLGLNFVNPSLDEGKPRIRVIAVDWARLAMSDAFVESSLTSGRQVMLPRTAIAALRRIVAEHVARNSDGAPLKLQFGKSELRVRIGEVIFVVEFVSGTFPDLSELLGRYPTAVLVVDRARVLKTMDEIFQLDRNVRSPRRLSAREGELVLAPVETIYSEDGRELLPEEHTYTIPCVTMTGDPQTVGFEHYYLTEALEHMDGKLVSLELTGPSTPIYIRDLADGAAFALVMPRRI